MFWSNSWRTLLVLTRWWWKLLLLWACMYRWVHLHQLCCRVKLSKFNQHNIDQFWNILRKISFKWAGTNVQGANGMSQVLFLYTKHLTLTIAFKPKEILDSHIYATLWRRKGLITLHMSVGPSVVSLNLVQLITQDPFAPKASNLVDR